jgi:hypothetical protein
MGSIAEWAQKTGSKSFLLATSVTDLEFSGSAVAILGVR